MTNIDKPVNYPRAISELPAVTLVILLAFISRILQIDHTPQYDEFYHMLAASSLLETGSLSIADGEYTRGALFTYLVAMAYSFFGEGIVVARLPSLIPGALLVGIVFLWTRRIASLGAACWTAFFLIFCPIEIYISQFSRFYALHAFTFFLGGIAWYHLIVSHGSLMRKFFLAFTALVCLAVAFSVQVTTAIGLAGLLAWTIIVAAGRISRGRPPVRVLLSLLAVILFGALAFAICWRLGVIQAAWERFRDAPGWAEWAKDNYRYYHDWFLKRYPTIWTILPVAAIVALTKKPAPAFFSAVIFLVGIVLHSVAGPKVGRYIAYLLPFLFIIWGIALAEMLPWFRRIVNRLIEQYAPVLSKSEFLRRSLLAMVLFIILAGNEAFYIAARMFTEKEPGVATVFGYRGFSDWKAASPVLMPFVEETALIITSTAPKALYYLGRSDAEINGQQLMARGRKLPEFDIDPRLGRPMVSTPESLALLMQCFETGLVIVERHHWRNAWAVVADTADFIEARMEPVMVPTAAKLVVHKWKSNNLKETAECPNFNIGIARSVVSGPEVIPIARREVKSKFMPIKAITSD